MATPTPDEAIELLRGLLERGDASPESLREVFEGVAEPSSSRTLPAGCKEILPTDGFVVKTTDEAGGKVFINVCGSSEVPLPGGWQAGEVPEHVKRNLAASTASVETLRLPLSLGEPRADLDHNGNSCLTIDCVYNESILKEAETFRKLKSFIIESTLAWIHTKHSLELSRSYKLPRMRYKGRPTPQVIRTENGEEPAAKQAELRERATIPLKFSSDASRPEKAQPALRSELLNPTASSVADSAGGRGQGAMLLAEKAGSARGKLMPGSTASGKCEANGMGKERSAAQSPQKGQRIGFQIELLGRPVHTMLATIEPPPGIRVTDASLEVQGDVMHVAFPGLEAQTFQLPFGADSSLCSCSVQDSRLRLELPYARLGAWLCGGESRESLNRILRA